tara:strand:+ start:94 stop:408 length:315 start_codon:yes stop_codon:yes gene_type:complete
MAYGILKQQELIELVRQHHPHMLEEEIRRALNRAQADFCAETEIIESLYKDTLVKDQRFYRLGTGSHGSSHPIIDIKKVSVGGEKIPRLIGDPPYEDKDLAVTT